MFVSFRRRVGAHSCVISLRGFTARAAGVLNPYFLEIIMNRTEHVRLMAEYNEWMNAKLYEAARSLPDDELSADRKAFFGSILGSLNHLVVADTIWLKRFSTHPANYPALLAIRDLPAPASLDQILFADIQGLSRHRALLDQMIREWAGSISEPDLDCVLGYSNTKGIAARRNFYALVVHFFNHQTHHRGQVTTLLSQAGVDVGVTDLLMLIPDETQA
ncbi:DinB family protein [Azoarcus sp. L1K30]|nr:DinB family protein [Azoarcus sp. L1K30]MBR0565603.1 DinB family protein [Azoarcus sp. L1K30]